MKGSGERVRVYNMYNEYMNKLYGENIYNGVNILDMSLDLSGCGGLSMFDTLFEKYCPKIVIEVGCWKGKTTTYLAKLLKNNCTNGVVFAVDTWLGSSEHYLSLREDSTWGIHKYMKHGKSNLYDQFLFNIIHEKVNDIIIPIVNTSTVAFELLLKAGVKADLIFIDADHGEDECYKDMCMYWELLNSGGILCGDDFSVGWYTVICAVNKFKKEYNTGLTIYGNKWLIVK